MRNQLLKQHQQLNTIGHFCIQIVKQKNNSACAHIFWAQWSEITCLLFTCQS